MQFSVGYFLLSISDLFNNFVFVRQLLNSFPEDLGIFLNIIDCFTNKLSYHFIAFPSVFLAPSDKIIEIVFVPVSKTSLHQLFLQYFLLLRQSFTLCLFSIAMLLLFLEELVEDIFVVEKLVLGHLNFLVGFGLSFVDFGI